MRRLALFTLIAALGIPAHAGSSKVGTSGAQFLKIGAGARPTAMGDAYTAIADDVNAIYFNPAGLGQVADPQITAMKTQWFQGLDYAFGAFALPTSHGTFGLSAATLRADNLDRRGADEASLGNFDTTDSAYTLSYGGAITDNFLVGGSARLIRLEIAEANASAWAGDIGVLEHFSQKRYSLGLTARNVGQKVKFNEESDPLPFVVDLGGATRLCKDHLLLGLTLSAPRDNDLQYGVGAEWAERRAERFRYAARLGYRSMATDADGATGVTVGAGIGYRRLDVDFAWVPMGDLGNTFRYAILFHF